MGRHVTAFFLGGTISMTPSESGGAVPRLGAADLASGLASGGSSGGESDIEVTAVDFSAVGSPNLTFEQLLGLARDARAAVEQGADGVVVVQGTDTMEESCYLLDLLWPHEAPLVFTGAMRNPSLPGADGPANLAAAVRVAGGTECRGLGALLVLGDEVHAARFVTKRHTSLPSAFVSPDTGPLGRMLEGAPLILTTVPRRPSYDVPERLARVGVQTALLDDDGSALRAVADAYDGLVVAGFGAGHVPGAVADDVVAIAERVPVVLTSRVGGGSVHTRTYGGPGSEKDLLGRGLVNGGWLSPLKARLLLAVLLAHGVDRDRIRAAFAEHGGGLEGTLGA